MHVKRSPAFRVFILVIVLILIILACGPSATSTPSPVTATALSTSPVQTSLPEGGGSPSSTVPVETPLPPADEATPTLQAHLTRPGEPGSTNSWITDSSSQAFADERRSIVDNFSTNQLERPFTSEIMDYQAHIDITRSELSLSDPWVYITIFLEGAPPPDSQANYGVEIDLDIDGRGDWLITGLVPPSSDWTTDGVRAYRDANTSVGGITPMLSDSPDPNRDGYEDLVFDRGYGPDPDAAWIRRDPSNQDRVQLAFKHSLIGSDSEFLWGAWVDEGVHEAAWFDYNDHFTSAEAGSPLINSNEYPLIALALVDNTCRWGFGFIPTGNEPGVCNIPPSTPTPTEPPCDWNGTWTIWIDGGPNGEAMTTTQTGNTIFATFDDGGMIYAVNGTVSDDGCTATGTAGDQGFPPIWTFTWMMQANLNQFYGNHDVTDYWCGARNGASQPSPCLGP
ncbi:MAG: hypothetical protein FVQ83_10410 [Chloroflexi bacterium]|nr:hypothetical protein [Chloroflexota bacterium]